MSNELSKAQLGVLKRMAEGRLIKKRVSDGVLTIGQKPILLSTFYALNDRGLVEETTEWGNSYTITPAGRAALEAAKEENREQ
jgi:hypothetical protein